MRIGDWSVRPLAGQMTRGDETVRVEARTMRLLLCLAENAGEVVSIDDLLDQVWQGVIVTPDSVYQAVTALRRLLGDDPKQPLYIATVPRRGYRMVATVAAGEVSVVLPAASPVASNDAFAMSADGAPQKVRRSKSPWVWGWLSLLVAGALIGYALLMRSAPAPQVAAVAAASHARSIAVLPFLDLTDTMNEEPFADGMTEELIDKLSQAHDLHVASPTSSFYFKDKQVTVAQVAKSLKVAYVLDGSVRKSGSTLRVAARLVRADDGFVAWSETYDRSWDDKLMIQDDIASEVSKALKVSIR